MFTTKAKTPRLLQIGRLIFMRDSVLSPQAPRKPEDVRDLQTKLYREIGITAVAAALRFTTQPEPATLSTEAGTTRPNPRRTVLAA
jgi:hypothetical protein